MLKTECQACGVRRKYKTLGYNQQLQPFCIHPNLCNRNHPNSNYSKVARGSNDDIFLMDYDQAIEVHKHNTELTYEKTANLYGQKASTINIHKLLTKTVSFRVSNARQADYISFVMGKIGSDKITDALVAIVDEAIEHSRDFREMWNKKQIDQAPAFTPQAQTPAQPQKGNFVL